MTFYVCDYDEVVPLRRPSLFARALGRASAVSLAVSFAALVTVGLLAEHGDDDRRGSAPAKAASGQTGTRAIPAVGILLAALDPTPFSARKPFVFGQSEPLRANFHREEPVAVAVPTEASPVVQSELFGPVWMPPVVEMADSAVPLPSPRPVEFGAAKPGAPKRTAAAIAEPAPMKAPESKGIFERLFGSSETPGPVLAYANPQDGLGSGKSDRPFSSAPSLSFSTDKTTAIYDISARMVYLPDGTRLEAHSGLRDMLDDPRHVHVKMRGATPPAVYDLTLRERLFHGVQAIRLTPTDSAVYGRVGLLAHTYMLGPNGDSNGCVSFKNYDAFLQAYLKGQIKRLTVVARLN